MFAQIKNDTLAFEGGFSDHPLDRGGRTNFGVTQATLDAYQDYCSQKDIATTIAEDVAHISADDASHIYQLFYYTKPKLHLLPQCIQAVMFDMAVNHGPNRAGRILQTVLNLSGLVSISVDGVIGPVTANAAQRVYEAMGHLLINALCDERRRFYQHIIAGDPTQAVFAKGWLRRAEHFKVNLA